MQGCWRFPANRDGRHSPQSGRGAMGRDDSCPPPIYPQIKQTIPDALIIHVIRDGRDVAASMSRMGWGDAFPWDTRHRLLVCGLYWQWLVQKGREYGRRLGPVYLEVHYKALLQHPKETMVTLGDFIHCDLNYDRIRQDAIGAVSKPNTSFG